MENQNYTTTTTESPDNLTLERLNAIYEAMKPTKPILREIRTFDCSRFAQRLGIRKQTKDFNSAFCSLWSGIELIEDLTVQSGYVKLLYSDGSEELKRYE